MPKNLVQVLFAAALSLVSLPVLAETFSFRIPHAGLAAAPLSPEPDITATYTTSGATQVVNSSEVSGGKVFFPILVSNTNSRPGYPELRSTAWSSGIFSIDPNTDPSYCFNLSPIAEDSSCWVLVSASVSAPGTYTATYSMRIWDAEQRQATTVAVPIRLTVNGEFVNETVPKYSASGNAVTISMADVSWGYAFFPVILSNTNGLLGRTIPSNANWRSGAFSIEPNEASSYCTTAELIEPWSSCWLLVKVAVGAPGTYETSYTMTIFDEARQRSTVVLIPLTLTVQ